MTTYAIFLRGINVGGINIKTQEAHVMRALLVASLVSSLFACGSAQEEVVTPAESKPPESPAEAPATNPPRARSKRDHPLPSGVSLRRRSWAPIWPLRSSIAWTSVASRMLTSAFGMGTIAPDILM